MLQRYNLLNSDFSFALFNKTDGSYPHIKEYYFKWIKKFGLISLTGQSYSSFHHAKKGVMTYMIT